MLENKKFNTYEKSHIINEFIDNLHLFINVQKIKDNKFDLLSLYYKTKVNHKALALCFSVLKQSSFDNDLENKLELNDITSMKKFNDNYEKFLNL